MRCFLFRPCVSYTSRDRTPPVRVIEHLPLIVKFSNHTRTNNSAALDATGSVVFLELRDAGKFSSLYAIT